MKASLLIFGYIFLLAQLNYTANAQKIGAKQAATLLLEKSSFDFGDIYEGNKVLHTFKFTNSGSAPLIITNVEVNCGCTMPKGWPKDPIMPGSRGELQVQFNSTGKLGRQSKVVTVVSNSISGNSQIRISANVLERK
jgi:hypothetical protein